MGVNSYCRACSNDILERIRTLTQTWPGNPTESYVIQHLIEQGLAGVEKDRPNAGRSGLAMTIAHLANPAGEYLDA